jgi:3-oxoacyl-[acyl-carrier protein] reductase
MTEFVPPLVGRIGGRMKNIRRTLFVTGASSDIGVKLIKSIHEEYDIVACQYRIMNEKLRSLENEMGEKLRLFRADFAEPEEVITLVEDMIAAGISPDHIVHLPALPMKVSHFGKMAESEYRDALEISLLSCVTVCKAFLPQMKKRGNGKLIIMLSAVTAYAEAAKYASVYAVTKYALLGLMYALHEEYASSGICVNGVSPTFVETKFLEHIDARQKEITSRAVFGSDGFCTVSDVVALLTELLSEECDASGKNIIIRTDEKGCVVKETAEVVRDKY